MYVAEYTDRGIRIVAAEAPAEGQRAVPGVAAHLNEKGFAVVDGGGAVEFTAVDQSYPTLRALFADE